MNNEVNAITDDKANVITDDDMPVMELELPKDRDEAVKEIMRLSNERMRRLNCDKVDQLTGKNCPLHTEKVVIPDYELPTQWLTKEVAGNKLYREVIKQGSIEKFVKWFNAEVAEDANTRVNEEMVKKKLMQVRLARDPWFAFHVCFKIKSKRGNTIRFILNRAQHTLLEELERMRHDEQPIRLILLKARQWGGSTLVQLYMAWIQLFVKEGWNAVIIAQTKDTARRIKAMYTRVLKNFPCEIVFGIKQLQFAPYEGSSSDSIITDESRKVIRDNVTTIASFENYENTRGSDFALVHLSEVAYWVDSPGKTSEGLITNIEGNLLEEPLTLEVMESTANGMSGYFYDEYQLAKEGKSGRKALFVPYTMISNDIKKFRNTQERRLFAENLYDKRHSTQESSTTESGKTLWRHWKLGATLEGLNWYVSKRLKVHDHSSIASEAPIDDIECFKHSGHTIFDAYKVELYRKENVREPVFRGDITYVRKENEYAFDINSAMAVATSLMRASLKLTAPNPEGDLWIWKLPELEVEMENRYFVIVDVGGKNIKSDFSVITVIDRMPLLFGGRIETVARWRGHIRYDLLALKAVHIARYYGHAHLVFESNTFDKKKAEASDFVESGDHIRGILSTIEDQYDNLYIRASGSPEDIRQGHYRKVGFQVNTKTKQDIVDAMIVEFEEDTLIVEPDDRFYKELAIYEQRPDGSYGNIVGKGNHDDILMTSMIGNFISKETPLPSRMTSISGITGYKGDSTINESFI